MSKYKNIVNKEDDCVRYPGDKGNEIGKLRRDLYSNAIHRVERGIDTGSFFESVTLCESMITDRIEALTQALLHTDQFQFITTSAVKAIHNLNCAMKKTNQNRTDEHKRITEGVKKWAKCRNEVIHNFVVVTNGTFKQDVSAREKLAEDTAVEGYKLFRDVDKFTKLEIKRIKNQ